MDRNGLENVVHEIRLLVLHVLIVRFGHRRARGSHGGAYALRMGSGACAADERVRELPMHTVPISRRAARLTQHFLRSKLALVGHRAYIIQSMMMN